MTATLSRLILAFTLVLVLICSYLPIFAIMQWATGFDESWAMLLASIVTVLLLFFGWVSIWYEEVLWTRWRRRWTVWSVVLCIIPSGGVIYLLSQVMPGNWGAGIFYGGVIWMICWIGSTAMLWRETKAERIERLGNPDGDAIRCLSCGYVMTELKQAECPDCGKQYTLDQLYAAVSGREI